MTNNTSTHAHQALSGASRSIWVTFQRAGFHRYPAAEWDKQLADVSYLSQRHRHLFQFRVGIQVWHNDRELEFHQVLNFCESLFTTGALEIDYKSVEMLADDLYLKLAGRYGTQRCMEITVSEDGECGCVIHYPAVSASDVWN